VEIKLLNPNVKAVLGSLFMAVILFWAVSSGINSGRLEAQAQAVLQTAQNLSAGLQYFYSDQNRFPSASEFADQSIMLNYFSVFPPVDLISSACSQSFVYKRISPGNFQLSFCLPKPVSGYVAGWNTINGNPPPAAN
jgi:hypothetical protein